MTGHPSETPSPPAPGRGVAARLFSGLGRNVFVLGLVSLFTDISSEMLYPVVPLFLTGVLGAPMAVLGLIEGIAESTASLLKMVSGAWSDRVGRREPFVIWGYSLSAFSKPLLFLAGTWHLVLAARILDRLGKGIRTSPRDVLIAAAAAPGQRGKAFGFHRAMDTVGACIGPLLAVVLLWHFRLGLRTIFLWAFVPAALGVACFAFLQKTPLPKNPHPILERAPLVPELKRFIAIYALFAIGNSSDVFLILRAKSLGFSTTMTLLTYVLYNFVYAAAATPAGWLSDRVSRRALMAGGFVVFAAVYGGFAVARAHWMIWGLFACYGLYSAATEGIAKAYVTDLAPEGRRGTAMGLMQMVTGIAAFFASLVAGALWQRLGPAAAFLYGAVCALAAALLFFVTPPGNPGFEAGSK